MGTTDGGKTDNYQKTSKPLMWKTYEVIGSLLLAGSAAFFAGETYGYIKGLEAERTPIKPIGFPKGYHIENVDIETRGEIIDVKRIPGENYIITENKKTGIITFKGEFEYDIKPSIWFTPNAEGHTDNDGNTLDKKYFNATRPGTVRLHKDGKPTGTINDKLK